MMLVIDQRHKSLNYPSGPRWRWLTRRQLAPPFQPFRNPHTRQEQPPGAGQKQRAIVICTSSRLTMLIVEAGVDLSTARALLRDMHAILLWQTRADPALKTPLHAVPQQEQACQPFALCARLGCGLAWQAASAGRPHRRPHFLCV
jgi:hypothetical protein